MIKKKLLRYLEARKTEFENEFTEINENDKPHPKYNKRERLIMITGAISALDIVIKDISNNDIGIKNLIK